MTTVGYGDIVPSQTTGKVLASILMIGGLALLSIVTATITSAFVARRQAALQASGEDPIALALEEMSTQLDSIESELRRIRAQPGAQPDPDRRCRVDQLFPAAASASERRCSVSLSSEV